MKTYMYLPLMLLAFITTSCLEETKSTEKPQTNFKFLKSYQPIKTYDALTNAVYYEKLTGMKPTKTLGHVLGYRFTYGTKLPDGTDVVASAAVMVPNQGTTWPLLFLHHGTLAANSKPPSDFSPSDAILSYGALAASLNIMVAIPDYIGYGASKDVHHPYEHAENLAKSSADLREAILELLSTSTKKLDSKIFITGYSEGATAALALHKHFEQNNVKVTASSVGAGAYNKTAFSKAILKSSDTLSFAGYYLWVLDAYNRYYKLNRTWSSMVKTPYDQTLSKINDPNQFPLLGIKETASKLFKEDFIKGVLDETDTKLLDALKKNDLNGWVPKAPIRFYYGTKDDFVWPLNSTTTVEDMKKAGATNVSLHPLEGEDHFTAIQPYFKETATWLIGML